MMIFCLYLSRILCFAIAIVNRGEPAVRFIRAMKEYNLEHDLQ